MVVLVASQVVGHLQCCHHHLVHHQVADRRGCTIVPSVVAEEAVVREGLDYHTQFVDLPSDVSVMVQQVVPVLETLPAMPVLAAHIVLILVPAVSHHLAMSSLGLPQQVVPVALDHQCLCRPVSVMVRFAFCEQ